MALQRLEKMLAQCNIHNKLKDIPNMSHFATKMLYNNEEMLKSNKLLIIIFIIIMSYCSLYKEIIKI